MSYAQISMDFSHLSGEAVQLAGTIVALWLFRQQAKREKRKEAIEARRELDKRHEENKEALQAIEIELRYKPAHFHKEMVGGLNAEGIWYGPPRKQGDDR